jgi:hypothetical protein
LNGEISILQHHDTITGTSYGYVNQDYINTVLSIMSDKEKILKDEIKNDILNQGLEFDDIIYCDHPVNGKKGCFLNITIFDLKERKNLYLAIYNPYLQNQKLINFQLDTSRI